MAKSGLMCLLDIQVEMSSRKLHYRGVEFRAKAWTSDTNSGAKTCSLKLQNYIRSPRR